jgi:hypothetical protein
MCARASYYSGHGNLEIYLEVTEAAFCFICCKIVRRKQENLCLVMEKTLSLVSVAFFSLFFLKRRLLMRAVGKLKIRNRATFFVFVQNDSVLILES